MASVWFRIKRFLATPLGTPLAIELGVSSGQHFAGGCGW